jgi:hypothetical protein
MEDIMNTPNNKRRKESIDKIEKAFIVLLQTKELDNISVSEICKITSLNRSTFYSNYIDIYDLADKVCKHLEEEFLSLYANEIKTETRSNDFSRLFHHIKENQLFYKTYFKIGNINMNITGLDTEMAQKYFDMKYIDYHIEFFKSGLNAVLKKWLNSGCKESPEEITEVIKSEYSRKF